METLNQNENVILRSKQVQARIGLSRNTVYRLMKSGKFPRSIKITDKTVGWLKSDIDSFIASKIAASLI